MHTLSEVVVNVLVGSENITLCLQLLSCLRGEVGVGECLNDFVELYFVVVDGLFYASGCTFTAYEMLLITAMTVPSITPFECRPALSACTPWVWPEIRLIAPGEEGP